MINKEEVFRIVNFPTIQGYLASISNDELEAIKRAESTIWELRQTLDSKLNEISYIKLKRDFSFTLQLARDNDLQQYTTPEVAKLLGRTPATVRNYINTGMLKAYKSPNEDIRVTKEDLVLFINDLRNAGRIN